MFIRLNKKGQNTAEYAIVISLIVAAAIAMQTYFKRGWQGGVKFAVDKLRKADDAGNPVGTSQFEPEYLESKYENEEWDYTTEEETKAAGEIIRKEGAVDQDGHWTGKGRQIDRKGYQKIKAVPTKLPGPK